MGDINYMDKTQEIEELVAKLPSILACKIVRDKEDKIIEIHILSSKERSPKQISRDVQSTLIAKWGIQVNHKIISIAQIIDTKEQYSGYKLKISQVEYSINDVNAEALVALKHKEDTYTGRAKGLNTANGAYRIIANATIKAVEDYMGKGPCFSIEDIGKTKVAKKDVTMVAVSLITNLEEKYFIGISYIDSDEHKSIVKSTLDALNWCINNI